jgi:mannose-6-phosphate isomerase-like protein (cupin superfamily)
VFATRFKEAPPYAAANHNDCEAVRIQGMNVSPMDKFWTGISRFTPGAGAQWHAGDSDKVYVVLEGEISLEAETESVVNGVSDSAFIGSNERRRIVNASEEPASWVAVIDLNEWSRSRGDS